MKDKIVELGINEGHFYIENRNKDRVFALTNAEENSYRKQVLMYLYKNKVLEGFRYIAYYGNASVTHDHYSFDRESGILNVYISALSENVQDNILIEDYLQDMFGVYKDFIKQYLAGYAYNNFEPRLPTLVLFGPRGTSKSTFSRLVANIFPSLQTP